MKYIIKTIVFILFSTVLLKSTTTLAQASYVEMLAGLSKPPFVIANKENGMQIDIIKAAFAKSSKAVQFTYLPLSRHLEVFNSQKFDGIITLTENGKHWGICLSKPYIIYQNVVITLAKTSYEINVISDLSNLRVAAFQNATKFLGKEYSTAFNNAQSYREIADQKSQIDLLFSGEVDALVMDIHIFKHLLANKHRENEKVKTYNQKFETHFLFKPKAYTAGFKSKELCQLFDQGVNELVIDGSYQKIIDSYL